MNSLLIASLVLREATRRRLVLTVALLTVAIVLLTGWGFHKLATFHTASGQPIPHYALMTTASILTIMMAFMFSVILCLGAAFLGALSTGAEIENGTLLAILPRPLSRAEVLFGKWLGNVILVGGYAAIIAGAEFAIVRLATGYLPPHPGTAIAFLIFETIAILTFTMFLSVRLSAIAAGFTAVVFFGLAWLGGVIGAVATVVHNAALEHATLVLSLLFPTDGIWRGAVFGLEPALLAAAGASPQTANPFTAAAPPSTAYLVWCAGWLAVVFSAAMVSFARRDI